MSGSTVDNIRYISACFFTMLFYFTLAVFVACAQAKFYTDCGSKLATVHGVAISGCDENAKRCVLKRNTNGTIIMDFTPSVAAESLEAVVHGVILYVPLPFPLPQPDACKDSGLTCPLKPGEKESYKATIPVLKSYPKVSLDVKWQLRNENGEDLICIMITARIK